MNSAFASLETEKFWNAVKLENLDEWCDLRLTVTQLVDILG